MKILNWRHTDWRANNFLVYLGKQIVGQLRFISSWNFNAIYTDSENKITFKEKGYFDTTTEISKEDGSLIGLMKAKAFGRPTIRLANSEHYELISNFWGRDVQWRDAKGEPVIKYAQATMNSMGKGSITTTVPLAAETEKILFASGLYNIQLFNRKAMYFVAIMIPLLVATRS